MAKFIVKSILILLIVIILTILAFLSFISIDKEQITKKMNSCYDKSNQSLWVNIQKMDKEKINKEKSCLLWKQSIEEMDTCMKNAFKIPTFIPASLVSALQIGPINDIQKTKEKQYRSCIDYPDTWAK